MLVFSLTVAAGLRRRGRLRMFRHSGAVIAWALAVLSIVKLRHAVVAAPSRRQ